MFIHFVQHPARFLSIALLIPLSFVLTLLAALDLPAAQAGQHTAVRSLASHDPAARYPGLPLDSEPFAPADGVAVAIVDFDFSPSVITITTGTVVTWTSVGSFSHTTTSDIGSSDPWDSGTLAQSGIFTRIFNVPGVYGYHCTIHPGMTGSVTVLTQVYLPLVVR